MFRWDIRVSRSHRCATATALITSAGVVMQPVQAKLSLFFCRIFCTGGRWDDFVRRYLLSRAYARRTRPPAWSGSVGVGET